MDNNTRFYELVRDTRRAQKQYFSTRQATKLKESTDYEDKLTRSITWCRANQGGGVEREIVNAAAEMLAAQQIFFAYKHQKALREAKGKEAAVDRLLKDKFDNQKKLF